MTLAKAACPRVGQLCRWCVSWGWEWSSPACLETSSSQSSRAQPSCLGGTWFRLGLNKSFQMLEHLGGGQLVQETVLTSTASFLFSSLGGRKFLLVQNPESWRAAVERGSGVGLVSCLGPASGPGAGARIPFTLPQTTQTAEIKDGVSERRKGGGPPGREGRCRALSRHCERPSTRGPSTVTRHAGGLPRRGAFAGLLRDLAGWLQNQGQGPGSSPAPSVCCLLSSRLLSHPSPWSAPCPRLALLWLLPSWPLGPCLPRLPGWVEPADGWSRL